MTIVALLAMFLLAAPLSAQQPDSTVVVIAPSFTVNGDSIYVEIDVDVNVNTDSLAVAFGRMQVALDSVFAGLGRSGGSSTVVKVGQGALLILGVLIVRELKRIADKPSGDTNVDVDVDNIVPPHGHKPGHGDHGESGEH